MPQVKLFSDTSSLYSPLLWGASPVHKRYDYIRDILVQHLGNEYSGILSAPSIQRDTYSWYSDTLSSHAVPLPTADTATQQRIRPKIDQSFLRVSALISEFESHKDSNIRQLASKLAIALQIPSEDYIYVDPSNDSFCLVAWGFSYVSPGEKRPKEGIKIAQLKSSASLRESTIKEESHLQEEKTASTQEQETQSPTQPENNEALSTSTTEAGNNLNVAVSGNSNDIPNPKGNKNRFWLVLLSILLAVAAIVILYLLFIQPRSDPFHGVLPEESDVLPPIDTTKIIIDEEDPLRQTIVANRLNVYLSAETDLKSFALDFKDKYPDPNIRIVYYTAAANRSMIEFPSDKRVEIKASLQASRNVEFIMDETIFSNQKTLPPFNDPGFNDGSKIWHLEAIQLFDAWKITQGNPNITIAIIDDGFDMKHPEFDGQIIHPWNIPANTNSPNGGVINMFHGTHVAGIAGAKADNRAGIAGIAPNCKVMPIQVGNSFGIMTTSSIVDGIFYAYHHGANVINLSLGSAFTEKLPHLPLMEQERLAATLYLEQEKFWTQLFKLLYDKGIVVVQASGNSNILSSIDPMQRNPYTIKVTATNNNNQKAVFSNFGDICQLSAPGTAIYSSVPYNRYNILDGTSMAAPIVSGAIALLQSKYPGITPNDCVEKLYNTGLDVGDNIGRLIQLADALDYSNFDNPCDEEVERLREEIDRLKEELSENRLGLIIPEEPDNLSFVEGLWKSTTDLFSTLDEKPVQLFFRFDKQGNGELTIVEVDGGQCKAPLKAKISPLKMEIEQLTPAICNRGRLNYHPYSIRCISSPNKEAVCVAVNKHNRMDVEFQLVKVNSY